MADREQVDLSVIVDQLCATPDLAERLAAHADQELPARATVGRSVEGIRSALFPGYFGLVHLGEGVRFHVAALLQASLRELRRQSVLAMRFVGRAASEAATAVDRLLHRLPELKRMLLLDVEAAYTGDPAARSRDEAIFSYPGVQAIIFHSYTARAYSARAAARRGALHSPHHLRGGALRHRHRDPSRGTDWRAVLHRPRHRGGNRRDL